MTARLSAPFGGSNAATRAAPVCRLDRSDSRSVRLPAAPPRRSTGANRTLLVFSSSEPVVEHRAGGVRDQPSRGERGHAQPPPASFARRVDGAGTGERVVSDRMSAASDRTDVRTATCCAGRTPGEAGEMTGSRTRANSRVMASPSPAPSRRRVAVGSTWANGAKTAPIFSWAIPIPVSRTDQATQPSS